MPPQSRGSKASQALSIDLWVQRCTAVIKVRPPSPLLPHGPHRRAITHERHRPKAHVGHSHAHAHAHAHADAHAHAHDHGHQLCKQRAMLRGAHLERIHTRRQLDVALSLKQHHMATSAAASGLSAAGASGASEASGAEVAVVEVSANERREMELERRLRTQTTAQEALTTAAAAAESEAREVTESLKSKVGRAGLGPSPSEAYRLLQRRSYGVRMFGGPSSLARLTGRAGAGPASGGAFGVAGRAFIGAGRSVERGRTPSHAEAMARQLCTAKVVNGHGTQPVYCVTFDKVRERGRRGWSTHGTQLNTRFGHHAARATPCHAARHSRHPSTHHSASSRRTSRRVGSW